MQPAKIFGSYDERTLAQMDRCMRLGSVVRGVIVYDEHVSISGVGFDIGCGNMAAK